jgi:8-oxo-dGTP pyrophosphatase MutT (NUDIX family)
MIYSIEPQDFNPVFDVVSCFVICDGKIMLLHRAEHKPEGGTWGTVAGKKDQTDITLQHAMEREYKEETGNEIDEQLLAYHRVVYVRYPHRDFSYHVFSIELPTPPVIHLRENEHSEYVWITPEEALRMDLVPDMAEVIMEHFHLETPDYSNR